MATINHNKKHDVNGTSDHTGVGGAIQGNLIQFDANGLFTDSGKSPGDFADTSKTIIIQALDPLAALATGDGVAKFVIPEICNGMNLIHAQAHVFTASTSGLPSIQIHNLTQAADMLTTNITIDANEKDSSNAATAPVIDTANDDVVTADEIRIDVDVAGTGAKGLEIRLKFQTP